MAVASWAIAFAMTLLAEGPIYVLSSRRSFGVRAAVIVTVLLNLVTHPLAWSLITYGHVGFPYGFFAVEGAVVVVEGLLLLAVARSRVARQPLSPAVCLAVAFAANCFSAGLGLLAF